VSKKARHNLCFGENSQAPDYENGKGTVVAFRDVPLLEKIRSVLGDFLGEKGKDLVAEGNLYFDIDACGIGFHGDAERRIVVAIRVGASIPLCYQWFLNGEAIGEPIEIILNHGDVYVMGAKAVGTDWRKKKIYTLRHAAGAKKFRTVKKRRKE